MISFNSQPKTIYDIQRSQAQSQQQSSFVSTLGSIFSAFGQMRQAQQQADYQQALYNNARIEAQNRYEYGTRVSAIKQQYIMDAADAEIDILNMNASIASINADEVRKAAKANMDMDDFRARSAGSEARAIFAGSGLKLTGSALNATNDIIQKGYQDSDRNYMGAAVQERNLRQQEANLRQQAEQTRVSAQRQANITLLADNFSLSR
jgi:hypothetical protein